MSFDIWRMVGMVIGVFIGYGILRLWGYKLVHESQIVKTDGGKGGNE